MKINFNKLTNDYQNNLLDTLRGFGGKDFLKYWVPDSNSYKSLLNLLDALFFHQSITPSKLYLS